MLREEQMLNTLNIAARTLREGKKVSAAWLQAGSSITSEILAQAGFDVLVVDLEHGPGDIIALIGQIQAMKGEVAVPFVRVPWNDPVWIKRVLDAGAYGLLVPSISSRAEAEAAVKAMKFPPQGNRGIAGSPRSASYGKNAGAYFDSANTETFLFVQIETPGGVAELDDILAVEGVDGVFIGPTDLAATHGFRGRQDDPAIGQIISQIEQKVLASNKILASICSDFGDAKAKYERGYQMVILMHDTVTLGKMANELVSRFQSEVNL
jgi:2-dehydro-3-deoxyglucarate aldolase/4-hydroxy-2-oxoheptanedioate aldolase